MNHTFARTKNAGQDRLKPPKSPGDAAVTGRRDIRVSQECQKARMTVGDNVNYPGQGPCRIDRIANRVIDGKTVAFYHLVVLVDGGELYVPVDKAGTIGVRPLLNRSEIPRLLETLKEISDSEKPETATNSKQRSIDNLRLLSTGSAFHLAEIVRSLAELRNTKALGLRETQILDKARRLLIAEIAVVLDETMSEAEERVDNSLEAPD